MTAPEVDFEQIVWSGKCSWYRVMAWRWKEVVALVFLLCAMSGFDPVMYPVDALAASIAETWFGWGEWREAMSGRVVFAAMGATAGWFVGQIVGFLMTHLGRRFYITRQRVYWGNKGELFSAPVSSITTIREGRALDGKTVKLSFSDGRRDLLIAGVPYAEGAATAIKQIAGSRI